MVDFSSLSDRKACKDGSVFVPKHPITGEPLDSKIFVVPKDSRIWVDNLRINIEKLRRLKEPNLTIEDGEDIGLTTLFLFAKGWEGFNWEGSELEFSRENFVMLFGSANWLARQYREYIEDYSNFLS